MTYYLNAPVSNAVNFNLGSLLSTDNIDYFIRNFLVPVQLKYKVSAPVIAALVRLLKAFCIARNSFNKESSDGQIANNASVNVGIPIFFEHIICLIPMSGIVAFGPYFLSMSFPASDVIQTSNYLRSPQFLSDLNLFSIEAQQAGFQKPLDKVSIYNLITKKFEIQNLILMMDGYDPRISDSEKQHYLDNQESTFVSKLQFDFDYRFEELKIAFKTNGLINETISLFFVAFFLLRIPVQSEEIDFINYSCNQSVSTFADKAEFYKLFQHLCYWYFDGRALSFTRETIVTQSDLAALQKRQDARLKKLEGQNKPAPKEQKGNKQSSEQGENVPQKQEVQGQHFTDPKQNPSISSFLNEVKAEIRNFKSDVLALLKRHANLGEGGSIALS